MAGSEDEQARAARGPASAAGGGAGAPCCSIMGKSDCAGQYRSALLAQREDCAAPKGTDKRNRDINHMNLCLTVIGATWEAFDPFPITVARKEVNELVLMVTTPEFGGLSAIGNRIKSRTICDVVGIMHADIMFLPGVLKTFAETAADRVVGMVGKAISGDYIWSRNVGKGEIVNVSTLDGSSIFFDRKLPIDFDESFDSFHCGAEDFCLQATKLGKTVGVPGTPWADHMSGYTKSYLNPTWQAAYWGYREKLAKKWNGTQFLTC